MADKTLEEKMAEITKVLVEDHPELGVALEATKGKDFAEAVRTLAPILAKVSETVDMGSVLERSNVFYQTSTGVDRLNPKYESYVAERVQFDGDAPELRHGALPKGAKPAVPVETSAKNPAMIGAMLKKASSEVAEEFKRIAENSTELTTISSQDPLGYERGSVPSLRKVLELTGSDLANMSLQEKKDNTWHFISTTQGRRSAISVLENAVQSLLADKDISSSIGEDGVEFYRYDWIVRLMGGENSTQNNFPYIEVATQAFVNAFMIRPTTEKEVSLKPLKNLKFKIETVDEASDRLFGWTIRFYGDSNEH